MLRCSVVWHGMVWCGGGGMRVGGAVTQWCGGAVAVVRCGAAVWCGAEERCGVVWHRGAALQQCGAAAQRHSAVRLRAE